MDQLKCLPKLFERNDIYVREVIDLGEKYWKRSLAKEMEP
jgi:hypothetical protein